MLAVRGTPEELAEQKLLWLREGRTLRWWGGREAGCVSIMMASAVPKKKIYRARCGARCRDGHACRAYCVLNRKRCRVHGGLSTGPRTPEGRACIAESNRRRAKLRALD